MTNSSRKLRSTAQVMLMSAAAAVLSLPSAASADWSPPVQQSLNLFSTRPAYEGSIVNDGGVPMVAWAEDGGSSFQIRASQLLAGSWVPAGGPLNVDQAMNAHSPSIAISDGTPYVAWAEQPATGTTQIRVKDFGGGSWTSVGGSLNFDQTKAASSPTITSVGTTAPFVVAAWVENTPGVFGGQIRTAKSTASGFQAIGTAPLNFDPTKAASAPSIANVGGKAYLAWSEQTTGTLAQIRVAKLGAGSWSTVAAPLYIDPSHAAISPSITDVGGVPYVAWAEGDGIINAIRVARLAPNGASWVSVGGPISVNGANATTPSIAAVNGIPVVTWTEAGAASQIHVARFADGSWQPVGAALNADPGENALDPMIVNVGGVPYVTSYEFDLSGTAQRRVTRLQPQFLSHSTIATATSALLVARVRDYGLPLPIGFEYGSGTSFSTQSSSQPTGGAGSDTLIQQVSGLTPATPYSWRALGTDGTGRTAVGPTQQFTTESLSGPGPAGETGAPGSSGEAGKDGQVELVTCKQVTRTIVKKVHGKRQHVKVTTQVCTAKTVPGPVTVKSAGADDRAILSRAGVVYASGVMQRTGTRRRVWLKSAQTLRTGRYTLTLTWLDGRHGRRTSHETIEIG